MPFEPNTVIYLVIAYITLIAFIATFIHVISVKRLNDRFVNQDRQHNKSIFESNKRTNNLEFKINKGEELFVDLRSGVAADVCKMEDVVGQCVEHVKGQSEEIDELLTAVTAINICLDLGHEHNPHKRTENIGGLDQHYNTPLPEITDEELTWWIDIAFDHNNKTRLSELHAELCNRPYMIERIAEARPDILTKLQDAGFLFPDKKPNDRIFDPDGET